MFNSNRKVGLRNCLHNIVESFAAYAFSVGVNMSACNY